MRAEVKLHDEDGKSLGTVYIPYDPDNQPPEDEVFAQANYIAGNLEYMRSIVKDDLAHDLARDIETGGTAKGIIDFVAEGIRGGLKIKVTADDGETPEELAELETVAREAERIVNDNIELFLEELAKSVPDDRGNLWQQFARDILAHALLWARDETRKELGDTYEAMGGDEFETLVLDAYHNGPHVTQAMLSLWNVYAGMLAEILGRPSSTKTTPQKRRRSSTHSWRPHASLSPNSAKPRRVRRWRSMWTGTGMSITASFQLAPGSRSCRTGPDRRQSIPNSASQAMRGRQSMTRP